MTTATVRPTRREQRRTQTLQEIKALAMEQISAGGPDALSLSGIVREMSMSPAAVYRYFANRDALLGDLIVDAYDELADFIVGSAGGEGTAEQLAAVLNAARTWALGHPNAYRLIFQTSAGSGQDVAVERTREASTRSMAAIVSALAASAADRSATHEPAPIRDPAFELAVAEWSGRAGFDEVDPAVLALALMAWTRLHGIISLELGGHLGSAGLDPAVLYAAEVEAIARAVGRIGADRQD